VEKTLTESSFDSQLADFRAHTDKLVHDRRVRGRETYGEGLEHTNTQYDWRLMALEEILDFAQYQQAEILRLQQRIDVLEARESDGRKQ
jgi:hypothetical protein